MAPIYFFFVYKYSQLFCLLPILLPVVLFEIKKNTKGFTSYFKNSPISALNLKHSIHGGF
jgi:hypothetical protein